MRLLILIVALFMTQQVSSQIEKVTLQASGLTCSMCSNAIYKALKKIPFVHDVQSDIKSYSFEISFKKDQPIDLDIIKTKVENAGFFVSAFYVTLHVAPATINQELKMKTGDICFQFMNPDNRTISGLTKIKVLDKGFVSSTEIIIPPMESGAHKTYHVKPI